MILFENTGHDKKITVNKFDLLTPKGILMCYEMIYDENTIYYSNYDSALNMRKDCLTELETKIYLFAVASENDQGGFQILDTHEIKGYSEWKTIDDSSFMESLDYYITDVPFDYLNEIFYNTSLDFSFLDDDDLSKIGLVCIFEHFNIEDNRCVDMDLEENLIKKFFNF